jgi:hypothetical protein
LRFSRTDYQSADSAKATVMTDMKPKKKAAAALKSALVAHVRFTDGVSRIDLARELSLAPSTIGLYVDRLIADGVLCEGQKGRCAAGRPPTILKLNPAVGEFVGTNDPSSDQRFGTSVSIFGNLALVGATADSSLGTHAGAAYLFRDSAIGWIQLAKFTADDANANAFFGNEVSLYDRLSLIGSFEDNVGLTRAGAAYFFDAPEPASALLVCLASAMFFLTRRRSRA